MGVVSVTKCCTRGSRNVVVSTHLLLFLRNSILGRWPEAPYMATLHFNVPPRPYGIDSLSILHVFSTVTAIHARS